MKNALNRKKNRIRSVGTRPISRYEMTSLRRILQRSFVRSREIRRKRKTTAQIQRAMVDKVVSQPGHEGKAAPSSRVTTRTLRICPDRVPKRDRVRPRFGSGSLDLGT
jgi:hypothetical protein